MPVSWVIFTTIGRPRFPPGEATIRNCPSRSAYLLAIANGAVPSGARHQGPDRGPGVDRSVEMQAWRGPVSSRQLRRFALTGVHVQTGECGMSSPLKYASSRARRYGATEIVVASKIRSKVMDLIFMATPHWVSIQSRSR